MRKPRWFVLYVLAAVFLGVLGLVETMIAPGAGRKALEVIVCVAGFAAMHRWVRAERRAMDGLGRRPLGIRETFVEGALGAPVAHLPVSAAPRTNGYRPCASHASNRTGTLA
jgi:hypothetical protein